MGRKRKKQLKGGRNQREILRKKVQALLDSKPGKPLSETQIIKRLGFRDKGINRILPSIIAELREDGNIRSIPDGRLQSNHLPDTIKGFIDHVSSRFAYLVIDDEDDVFIRDKNMNSVGASPRLPYLPVSTTPITCRSSPAVRTILPTALVL